MSKSVLFDLDGTLLDTAQDMLYSLHLLAKEKGLDITPSYEKYKELITYGSKAIVASIFGDVSEEKFIELQQRYLQIYQQNLTEKTTCFDGIELVLSTLDKNQIPWGIVTNKPYHLSEPLLQAIPQLKTSQVLIGGDSTPFSKPHPYPLLKAAETLQVAASDILYVGDAKTDIQAAQAANMRSAVASWGYLKATDQPEEWQADVICKQPEDILKCL